MHPWCRPGALAADWAFRTFTAATFEIQFDPFTPAQFANWIDMSRHSFSGADY